MYIIQYAKKHTNPSAQGYRRPHCSLTLKAPSVVGSCPPSAVVVYIIPLYLYL
jgi:hypothetical protein